MLILNTILIPNRAFVFLYKETEVNKIIKSRVVPEAIIRMGSVLANLIIVKVILLIQDVVYIPSMLQWAVLNLILGTSNPQNKLSN